MKRALPPLAVFASMLHGCGDPNDPSTTASATDTPTSAASAGSSDPTAGTGDATGDATTGGQTTGASGETTGASGETTGESETTGGELSGCDLALDASDQVAPGDFPLGAFTVSVDEGGALRAAPTDEPAHAVLESPSGAPMIAAARVDLEVEESQGSFMIDAALEASCAAPTVDRLLHGGPAGAEVLAIEGRFADPSPACAALRFSLRLCEVAPGHLGFDLSTDDPSFDRLTLRVAAAASERVFGAGEQFAHDTLDLKGRTLPILAQEGGIGRGHGVIAPAVNAYSKGAAGSESTTYYAAPHYLTSGLRSLVLEGSEYAELDFSADATDELRLYGPRMIGRALHGDTPLDLIETFTAFAGRMEGLPAWTDAGAVVALARPLDESAAIVADLVAHGAQIAAVWNQTWSGVSETFIGEQVLWNWVQNPNDHPGWGAFVDAMEAQGIRVLCYVNPMLRDVPPESEPVPRDLYDEAIAGDYFVHDPEGDPYLMTVTAFEVGLLDLANEAARAWMKGVIRDEMIDGAGCSGWMADFAEALPFDAVMGDGEEGARWHNRYPVEWIRLSREAIDEAGEHGELLVFNRSGHTRTPAHAMLLWEGDQLTTWDKYDGLVSALHGLISGGFSGISLNHSDTGGYTSLSWLGLGYDREAEQLKRWTEMSAFTALLRTHEGNQPALNAQVYADADAMAHFARFTKVFRALGFYRAALREEAASRGWPLVRHLWLHYPDDPKALAVDDQFLGDPGRADQEQVLHLADLSLRQGGLPPRGRVGAPLERRRRRRGGDGLDDLDPGADRRARRLLPPRIADRRGAPRQPGRARDRRPAAPLSAP